ncbi:MAG: hypothetical protein DRO87_06510 [Candidatus Thorarchaeota archaeon]|nr:MAG: hypothetical protein DRO87_06510 [Candidatus Thorarchaeota archaeon]RLI58289.1 MAG: hypothetical protein DRP09_00710 [Candidatus Thorarchaeota archaeon]
MMMETIEERNEEAEKEPIESDIITILKAAGYRTREYPNGISLGVRLEGIPGSRCVHADVIHVLDMRTARFGNSTLAVQSSVLDNMNLEIEHVLEDVGLSGILHRTEILSPHGRRHFTTLKTRSGTSSYLVESRMIYVVHSDDAPGPGDLEWLTSPNHIVRFSDFGLIQKSDARSLRQEVKGLIVPEKWTALESGLRASWRSILPLIAGMASLIGLISAMITSSGSLLFPAIVAGVSFPLSAWLHRSAQANLSEYDQLQAEETASIESLGDRRRVSVTVDENHDRLRLVGDLRFIVTPLIGGAIVAIESRDVEAAVSSLCAVIDEWVRLSPGTEYSKATVGGDPGLAKFLHLFNHLGVADEGDREASLSLAYAALSGHATLPVPFEELIAHTTTLLQALYDCGILTADVKDTFDDILNKTAAKSYLEETDPDEEETVEDSSSDGEDESGIDADSLAEMAAAGLDPPKEAVVEESEETVLVARTIEVHPSPPPLSEPQTGESVVKEAVAHREDRGPRKEREAVEA